MQVLQPESVYVSAQRAVGGLRAYLDRFLWNMDSGFCRLQPGQCLSSSGSGADMLPDRAGVRLAGRLPD